MKNKLGFSYSQLAPHVSNLSGIEVTANLLKKRILRYLDKVRMQEYLQPTFSENFNGAEIIGTSKNAPVLDELLKACNVDLNLWKVESHSIRMQELGKSHKKSNLTYDNGKRSGQVVEDSSKIHKELLYTIAVRLTRRIEYPYVSAIESVIDRLEQSSSGTLVPKPLNTEGDYLLIPSMYDAHFGKRSIDGKSVKEAAIEFDKTGEAIIARALALPYKISRIMFPVGHDAIHADTLSGTTTKGTWVEISTDLRDAIDVACTCYITMIERLAMIAPVDVIIIQGNHDRLGSYWLGKVLEARFKSHEYVTVRVNKIPREYYKYGSTLIGLEHGDTVKPKDLVGIMASEASNLWGGTKYRIWLKGHYHKKEQLLQPITEEHGVSIYTMPSLCSTDEWHNLHGYVGQNRACEAMYIHSDYGPAGNFPVFADEIVANLALVA